VVVTTMTGSFAEIYDKTGGLVRTEEITTDGKPTVAPAKPGARPVPRPVRPGAAGKPAAAPASSNAPSTEITFF